MSFLDSPIYLVLNGYTYVNLLNIKTFIIIINKEKITGETKREEKNEDCTLNGRRRKNNSPRILLILNRFLKDKLFTFRIADNLKR